MKLGRGTKRFLGAAAAIAVVFLLAHSGPAKGGARALLTWALGRLSGGEATLETLDYRLWRGEVGLSGLELASREGAYRFGARHVGLQVTGFPRFSLQIQEPTLSIHSLTDGSVGAADAAPLAGLRYVDALRVEQGTVELFDSMRFENVEADLLEVAEGHRLVIHTGTGRVRVSDADVDTGPLDADAILTTETIRVVSASLHKDASFVRAEGEVELARELRAPMFDSTRLSRPPSRAS
ncbi:MAG TPA: hypothetical protein VLK65_20155 [Vicinamibacteria bacterium]|nr:hypothetical protein [Vicinamibacteria bacterium]